MNQRLAAMQRMAGSQPRVREDIRRAVREDATVFEYDRVYDGIDGKRREEARTRDEARRDKRPRYVEGLLEKAKERRREQEVARNRAMLRERMREDHLHEGKEKFVTSAYREKLREDERLAEEERERDRRDDATSARARGGVQGFLSNVLKDRLGERPPQDRRLRSPVPPPPPPPRRREMEPERRLPRERDTPPRSPPAPSPPPRTTPSPPRYPRRNDEAAVRAARERYLARRRRVATN